MNNKCNYITFFNEFNIDINRKLCFMPLYNGYYSSKSYKIHLNQTLEKFRHDLFYELPLYSDGDKEAFLVNLYRELNLKHTILCRLKRNKINSIFRSLNIPLVKLDLCIINKLSKRRIVFMYYKQKTILNNALEVVTQAASTLGVQIEKQGESKLINQNIKWDGKKLEFIQVIKSLMKNKKILYGRLTETQAINEIANSLNLTLTNSNYSSLSRAIHFNNYDYKPVIFEDLEKAYKVIVSETIEKHEKVK